MAKVRNWSQGTGRFVLAFVTVVSVSGACASSSPSAEAPSSPPPASSVSPSGVASPAADLVVGGDRPVTVHIPGSYDPREPAPLLILLHGYSGTGPGDATEFKLAPAAEAGGFIAAYPDGTVDSQGNRFWNATDAACDFDRSGADDVGYLTDLIAEIEAQLAIDPKRIYVFGHSCGGFMAYRLACEKADVVAAIVSVAGATYADPAACAPNVPVSVAQIHGTADDIVLFEGGDLSDWDPSGPPRPYPGAKTTAETWAAANGCAEAPTTLDARIDVDAGLRSGTDQAETSVQEWTGCTSGATVQLWTIPDGGHMPTVSPSFAETVLGFMLDHPKP
jgi:polyhydroxybutyrate depolymerase